MSVTRNWVCTMRRRSSVARSVGFVAQVASSGASGAFSDPIHGTWPGGKKEAPADGRGSSVGAGRSEGNDDHHHEQQAYLADGHHCGFDGACALSFHGNGLFWLLFVVDGANLRACSDTVSSDRATGGLADISGWNGSQGRGSRRLRWALIDAG